MDILFNGLGPNDSISYNGKIFRNGSFLNLPEHHAAAFLNAFLAVPASHGDAAALQKLESNNLSRRAALLNSSLLEVNHL